MKRTLFLGCFMAVLVLLLSAPVFPAAASAEAHDRTTLTIKGMTCGGCVAAVKMKLKKTAGVTAYEVSLERGEADVDYDPSTTDPKTIADSVSETGFAASVKADDGSRKGTSMAPMPEPRVLSERRSSGSSRRPRSPAGTGWTPR